MTATTPEPRTAACDNCHHAFDVHALDHCDTPFCRCTYYIHVGAQARPAVASGGLREALKALVDSLDGASLLDVTAAWAEHSHALTQARAALASDAGSVSLDRVELAAAMRGCCREAGTLDHADHVLDRLAASDAGRSVGALDVERLRGLPDRLRAQGWYIVDTFDKTFAEVLDAYADAERQGE